MTTRVLTQGAQRLFITVDEDDWSGLYTKLCVFRSTTGAGGPYNELTNTADSCATIPETHSASSSIDGPLALIVGKDLLLEKDGVALTPVVFIAAHPAPADTYLTYKEASVEINTQLSTYVVSYVDEDGNLVLNSSSTGNSASLKVLGGEAAPLLKLPLLDPDNFAIGRSARITLSAGVTTYNFTDFHGDSRYFYKTCFTGVHGSSELTDAVAGTTAIELSPTEITLGFMRVVDWSGAPRQLNIDLFCSHFVSREDCLILSNPRTVSTDAEGYIEIPLIRGSVVEVSIPGTQLRMKVHVPTDLTVTRFNMLSPTYSVTDAFTVQRPEVPYAERRDF